MVKANGYGHGAAAVSRACLEAGADWLAVAQVDEAVVLRDAGIEAPLLLLSEPRHDEIDDAVATGARLTVYTSACVAGHRQGGARTGRRPSPARQGRHRA